MKEDRKWLKKIIASDKYHLLQGEENTLFYILKRMIYKLQTIFN